jgi:hypothetical protein
MNDIVFIVRIVMIYKNNRLLIFVIVYHAVIFSNETIYQYQKKDISYKLKHIISLDQFLHQNPQVMYQKCDEGHDVWCPISEIFLDPQKYNFICVEQPETFVLMIPEGKASSAYGLINPYAKCINELIWEPSLLKQCPRKNSNLSTLLKKISGRVVMLLQQAAGSYYHWMLEVLPKIGMLHRHGVQFDLIYTYYHKPYMQETLEMLGFDDSKIIAAQGEYEYVQADELIVPSFVSRCHYSVPETLQYLQKALIPQAQDRVDVSKFSKKVFISRKRSYRRKIINESDIIQLLEKKGFVAYCLEEMSIAEQIVLFYNAEIIVAEHGAGLTNLVFCRPQTKVVEIFHSRKVPTYFDLSQQLDLDYVGCVVPDDSKKAQEKEHSLNTLVSLEYMNFIIENYID